MVCPRGLNLRPLDPEFYILLRCGELLEPARGIEPPTC